MSQDLAKLNKDAITAAKKYMGQVTLPTVFLTLFILLLYTANLLLFAQGVLPVWAATLLMAICTYISYTPLHEAAHGNISGNSSKLGWLNDLCGYLVAPLIAIPYESHRHEHFTHHQYTNKEGKDPDFMVKNLGDGPVKALTTLCAFLWLQISFFAATRWKKATLREKVIYCTEISISLGWRLAFVVLIEQTGAAIVICIGYLMGAYFTTYWFAYRPHLPYHESKRYQNTNSLIVPRWMKPIEWFWLGQNLHSVHHLFPRVPFYRYHALHKEIEPILRAHETPIIGMFDRQRKTDSEL